MKSNLCVLKGYNQTNFEIVSHKSGNYELPISKSTTYKSNNQLNINKFKSKIEKYNYILISPHIKNNYLSSKVYGCETNEFFHIKIINTQIQIFPKNKNFSFKTFYRIINTINDSFVQLRYN